MKAITNIYIVTLTALLLGCGDKFINDIDIEIPDQEKLAVINLELEFGDTIAQTFVSRTANINEPENTFFEDAQVTLYKDGDVLRDLIFDTNSANYIGNFDPTELADGDYAVEVSNIDGLSDIFASQSMPDAVPIQSAEFEEDGGLAVYYGYAYSVDEITIQFDDPIDEENFYSIDISRITENSTGQIINGGEPFMTSANPLVEVINFGEELIMNDNTFSGKRIELSFGLDGGYYDSNSDNTTYLLVELSNISRDNYLFKKSLDASIRAEGNPFAEPVIVHNNLENGIGIFRTSNTSTFRIDL